MLDRAKAHVKRHKVVYSFGAGVTVTLVAVVIFRQPAKIVSIPSPSGLRQTPLLNRPFQFMGRNNTMLNVIAVVARNGRGHPGYPVLCKETKDVFLTQGGAAAWAGGTAKIMSMHIRGKLPDVNGYHFERLIA